MLHNIISSILLKIMGKAEGTYSSDNYPFSTAGYKEADVVVNASSISGDEEIVVTIYKIDLASGQHLILHTFAAITENSIVSKEFTSNIGNKVYAKAVVTGTPTVSVNCTISITAKT